MKHTIHFSANLGHSCADRICNIGMHHIDNLAYAFHFPRAKHCASANHKQRSRGTISFHAIYRIFQRLVHRVDNLRDSLLWNFSYKSGFSQIQFTRSHCDIRQCQLVTAKNPRSLVQPVSNTFWTNFKRIALYYCSPTDPDGHNVRHAEKGAHTAYFYDVVSLAWITVADTTNITGCTADINDHCILDSRQKSCAPHTVCRA